MKVNTEKIQTASVLSRIIAFFIDFGLAFFISSFGGSLAYRVILNSGGELTRIAKLEEQNVASSHLAKNNSGNLVSYTSDEYFSESQGESGYLIIDSLSYFYNVYLAGDETKASTGDIVSQNANKEITYNDTKIIPHEYFTISWFNENVLALPRAGQTPKPGYDFFSYQQTDLGEDDYSKIGVVSDKYIEDGVVAPSEEMVNFTYEEYKKAASTLYDLDYMVEYSNYMLDCNQTTIFVARMIAAFIFFILLPLLLKRGKSLGKLFFGLSLVNLEGENIKKWQVLPRGVIMLLIPVVLYFINIIYIQIAIVGVLALADLVLFIVNKNTRMVIHDYIAQTVVKEDERIVK